MFCGADVALSDATMAIMTLTMMTRYGLMARWRSARIARVTGGIFGVVIVVGIYCKMFI